MFELIVTFNELINSIGQCNCEDSYSIYLQANGHSNYISWSNSFSSIGFILY
jgi:hypothetical protein